MEEQATNKPSNIPWHKPEVIMLTINLDTETSLKAQAPSGADGFAEG